ncbi:hypothetical protein FDJ70_09705 [Clostridium botulinum]|uniref:Uncharacterized protein n=1 Tax=Clostridium botulinum TaxID=1491 RepID=C4IXI8_CLOBO|nr:MULTISPECIES: hypothetical protein [Clostridium]AYF55315.1 hypothetical protein DFH04_11310 [Clostridium novyi]KEI06346.1 hypothetical protein Z957_p0123 [Clostridium sp. K25]MBO3442763.1 hypothetical protein [Clostridium haemolyticum]MCD3217250.1 hypothetical protein [Clostridium botulinum C]MCD3245991.1 hypothetical protein [Clostridium botulinum C]
MNKQISTLYCILASLFLIWAGSTTCKGIAFSLLQHISWLSFIILNSMRMIAFLGIILLIFFSLKLIKENY